MLVDELSRMTPETQHALLSAEGEKWHGEWGVPHGRTYKRKQCDMPKVGASHGKFTKSQRQFIKMLREKGKTSGINIKKRYGFCPHSVSHSLIKNGFIEKSHVGNRAYYELTEKGQVVELVKSDQEQVRAYMIELGRFYMSELEEKFGPSISRTGVRNENNAGRLVKIDQYKPYRWEWVG